MKLAPDSFAMALARSVFPHPGGLRIQVGHRAIHQRGEAVPEKERCILLSFEQEFEKENNTRVIALLIVMCSLFVSFIVAYLHHFTIN